MLLCWGSTLIDLVIILGGFELRRRHLMGCRTYWRIRAVWSPISEVCTLAFFFLLSQMWGDIMTALMLVAVWNAIRTGKAEFSIEIRLEVEGRQWVIQDGNFVVIWRECRRHRDHDDDCTFGPTRHPFQGLVPKLATWQKISINPAFAPA